MSVSSSIISNAIKTASKLTGASASQIAGAAQSYLSKNTSSGSSGASAGTGTSASKSTTTQEQAKAGATYTANGNQGGSYYIGSEAGVNFVNNASAGSTMTGGDGSTWTKNANGSVTITKNGQSYTVRGTIPQVTQQAAIPSVVSPAQQATDLTEYIRQQKAAEIESTLANLKSAYQKSINGYDATSAQLPALYESARNSAAANNALARQAFNERAAASGLNTGTSGQAELARSSTYQDLLAGIDRQQSNAEADIALQRANLDSEYQSAIAQARANNDADTANALYQELVRQQEQDSANNQAAQQYALQLAQLGAGYGDYSGLNSLGIDSSAYEAQLAAESSAYKPTFTQAQVIAAAKAGTLTGNMLRDYNYYFYGDPDYSAAGGVSALPAYGSANSGGGYDNGGLTAAQIKELQRYYGVSADGLWGPLSSKAAGGKSAKDAWAAYQAAQSVESAAAYRNPLALGGPNRATAAARMASLDYSPDEGVFTWNGQRYSSKAALAGAFEAAYQNGLITETVFKQLIAKANAYGIRFD